MISRRNIRIKVMQTLYTVSVTGEKGSDIALALRLLDDKLEQTLDIFTFSVLLTVRVAQYAEKDAEIRAGRYLKSEEDKNINARIAANSVVLKLTANNTFRERIEKNRLERLISQDWVKKIFVAFSKTDEYKNYALAHTTDKYSDISILQFIWEKHILANEDVVANCADELPGWEDDCELIVMLMQNFFRNYEKVNFSQLLDKNKRLYAHELIKTVIEKKEMCLGRIATKLNNWDKDRVALIDILLIRMGICELLFFPTIPTKVTINEYIDIAKQYSTPQSGQFVNGVLDNILKDFVKENLIHKEDNGKS